LIRRWRAADPETLDWVSWNGEFVLFHRRSGKTHFVNGATASLLRDILREPCDLDAIVARLAPGASGDEYAEIRAATLEQLWRLEELGLVEVQ
jgi:PqqD family protein of HPr-rel-A system